MPLTSLEDGCINQLREVILYFHEWNSVYKTQKESLVAKKDIFVTMECYNDL